MAIHMYTSKDWSDTAVHIMHRPRLYDMLDEHSSKPVIGILADSGFGKTALIEGYLSYYRKPALICTFYEGDSVESLMDEIASLMQEHPEINNVVFDNCSYISGDTSFANSLQHLYFNNPNSQSILIGTALPPLPYAVLRGKNEYHEFTHEDLALTPDEIYTCFNEFWNLPLDTKEAEAIYSLTRGWFTSVQLLYAYLYKRQPDDLNVIDMKFVSGITDINDYLSYTFYESQQNQTQALLRRISAVTDIDEEIIEKLLGPDAVSEIKHVFEEFHGLVYKTNDGKLRLHPLLRQFLYQKHMQIDRSEYLHTHSRLAEIYEKRRQYIAAFAHAIASNSYKDATRIMRRIKDRYNPIQLINLLDGTLDEISPALLFSNTTFFLQRCMPEELLLALVQPLTETIHLETNPYKLTRLQHRLGCIHFHLGHIQAAHRLIENSLGNASPQSNVDVMIFNYQLLADCCLIRSDIDEAVRNARNALFLAEQHQLRVLQFHSLEVFSRIRLATQDLAQARDYIEQAMELVSEYDYENFWLYTAMSTIDRSDGMAEDAVLHAQKALDFVKDSLSGYDQAYAHLTLAQALLSAGKDEEVIEHFEAAYKQSSLCKLLHAEVLESMIPVCTDGKARMKYEQELHALVTENEYTWISSDSDQEPSDNSSDRHSMIHIQTFGQFAISCNNLPINIKRSASIRLLLLLIVNQGRWVNKDYIVDQLFPDSTASSGINNFNVALSVLRKTLDAAILSQSQDSSCILREKDRYQLNLDLISLDTRDFEQQYLNLKKTGSEDFMKWLNLYGLYCGEFLPEFPYESFLEMERERFNSYRKDTLLTIARLFAGQDDVENAWSYYEQALTADPYDEDIYYETLEMLLDHDALSWARITEKRMKQYLEEELGVPCSSQIQSMFDYYYKQKSSV